MSTVSVLRKSPFSPSDAPAWWSPDGEQVRLLKREHPNYVADSLLTLGKDSDIVRVWIKRRFITAADHSRFTLHWHPPHIGKPGGTSGEVAISGQRLLEVFSAEERYDMWPGLFVRQGRYINFPGKRQPDDGTDQNVSLYLTDDIVRAVRELTF